MQWFLIKRYRLSKDDAVRFLGGDGTDLLRQSMVHYLKQDKESFRESFEKLKNQESFAKSRFALITYLRNDLLAVPVPKDQPDLKPPGVETIAQAVRNALEKK